MSRVHAMGRWGAGIVWALLVAACGGEAPQASAGAVTSSVPCAKFACVTNPDGSRSAVVTASPDQTNSLTNNCAGAGTCNDAAGDKPVCVEYVTAGGIQLDLFACPVTCCQ